MQRLNARRVVLCGLLAGVAWTVLSSIVTVGAGQGFAAAVPDNRLAAPTARFVALLFALNLVEGIWAMWLYAAIRPRYGAGAWTAVRAGIAWWVITSLVDATWGSFGFVPVVTLIGPMLASLPCLSVAALAGAVFYRE